MLSHSILALFDIIGTKASPPEPSTPIGLLRDSFGNVCGRLVAPAGGVTLRGSRWSRFRIARRHRPSAQAAADRAVPDDVMLYLMASRYCETDKLTDVAWSLFAIQRRAGSGGRGFGPSCTTTSASAINTPIHEIRMTL